MSRLKSPFFWFILAVLTTAGLTSIGPEERSLGENVRIIYLHDAWLLTAEAALGFAALVGLLAILTRRDALHRWSAALGRTGIFFWVTYLPLALWAFQTNWGELFQTEPRFQATVALAATGVVLQIVLTLIARPMITSLVNVLFYVALQISVSRKGYIMHPTPSPIFGSGILSIELFFIGIIFLTIAAAYFMTRWWLSR
ncbi:MAG: hypothetical protein ABSB41_17045 [Anaerolineales bacterium]|jgi:hypothetical protein